MTFNMLFCMQICGWGYLLKKNDRDIADDIIIAGEYKNWGKRDLSMKFKREFKRFYN